MLRSTVSLLCILAAFAGADRDVPRAPSALAAHAVRTSPSPLPFFYDLYTFRGDGGSTAVVAAFAVPVGMLQQEEIERGVQYRFDVTLVLADTARRWVTRRDDSVFVRFRRPLLAEHVLYTQLEVQASPSSTTVQRVIMTDATTPGVGQLYDSAYPIPDYRGTELMLSDIALGLPGAKAGWKRGDVTLALLPTSQFPRSAFEVFYEVYNLPAGHRYTTEVSVEHADTVRGEREQERRPVRIRFSGRSEARADGTLPELRQVDTSLSTGRWRITVTVTDEVTHRSASRSRTFHVHGWERGATLVAALPQRAP